MSDKLIQFETNNKAHDNLPEIEPFSNEMKAQTFEVGIKDIISRKEFSTGDTSDTSDSLIVKSKNNKTKETTATSTSKNADNKVTDKTSDKSKYSQKANSSLALKSDNKSNLTISSVASTAALSVTTKAYDVAVTGFKKAVDYDEKTKKTQDKGGYSNNLLNGSVKAAKGVADAVFNIVSLILNPIHLISTIILIVLLIIGFLFLLFMGIIDIANNSLITPKDMIGEEIYIDIQSYLRQKDSDLIQEFENYPDKPEYAFVDDFLQIKEVIPSTSMKIVSAYLVAKYDNKLTLDIAKTEIDTIHAKLYSIQAETTTVTHHPATGSPIDKKWLIVRLTGISLKDYMEENISTLLDEYGIDMYLFLLENSSIIVGDGTIGPPFADFDWRSFITSRFGSRAGTHHNGLDIGKPEGTPILSIITGTVVDIGFHATGLGYYVKMKSTDGAYLVRYGHMLTMPIVSVGDTVSIGETIGHVGNTGKSTGNHLHIEIEENGNLVDPELYLPE